MQQGEGAQEEEGEVRREGKNHAICSRTVSRIPKKANILQKIIKGSCNGTVLNIKSKTWTSLYQLYISALCSIIAATIKSKTRDYFDTKK